MTRSFWYAMTAVLALSLFPAEASGPAGAPLPEPRSASMGSPDSCASGNFVVATSSAWGTCDDIDCCGGPPEAPCGKLKN